MNRWLPWLASAALVAVGGGAVYVSTVGLGGTQAATLDYITQAAQQTDVTVTSAASGSVSSAASYALAFGVEPSLGETAATSTVTWTVDDVLVSLGDRVSAGQTLAVAESADLGTQLDSLRLDLEQAQMTLADAKAVVAAAPASTKTQLDTIKLNIASLKKQLSSARSERAAATAGTTAMIAAKLNVTNLKSQLEDLRDQRDQLVSERKDGYPDLTLALGVAKQALTDLQTQIADLQAEQALAEIVSPVDGIVSTLDISAGYAAPSGTAVVVDSDTLEVAASVVESDIGSLSVGQAATVSIDAVGEDVDGVVTSVVPTTTASTSSVVSYPVTITLTDPDAAVLAGMGADVEIVIDQATDVVAVPVTALSGQAGNYTVQVVADDGSTSVRNVTVGLVTETLAEIQSGLAAGEQVVVGTTSDRTSSSSDDSQDTGNAFSGIGDLSGAGGFSGGPPSGGFPGSPGGQG